MTDLTQELLDAMYKEGIDPAGAQPFAADGAFHRWGPHRQRYWYVIYDHAVGVFGDWLEGVKGTVVLNGKANGTGKISAAERKRIIAESKAKAERERAELNAIGAAKADRLWETAVPFGPELHPYLIVKCIKPHGTRRRGTALMVPMFDVISEKRVSAQFILPNGTKRFCAGARALGTYYPIASEGSPEIIIIAEGFATAATIFEATGIAVAVAFFAGNLKAVAVALRKKFRKAKIIIAADDDRDTDGNPGVTKATEAAKAARGFVAVPKFANAENGTDYNDLARAEGAEVVRDQIAAVVRSTERPRIQIIGGALARNVDDIEEVLGRGHKITELFERAGQLVTVGAVEKADEQVYRPAGAIVVRRMTPTNAADMATRHIYFWEFKMTKRGPAEEPRDCSPAYARAFVERGAYPHVPSLRAVITAPLLLANGRLLMEPGYDSASGLYLASRDSWPAISDAPTRAQATEAARTLLEPLKQMAFVDAESTATALSSQLSGLERVDLPAAPAVFCSSPLQAVGKGLFVDCRRSS
jgi:phage/plasmid primase-like uncharacterized protein